ncbi:hypothetical protein B0A55_01779 [Friedmanniomyces simplex]|uniref:WSC domain-containing protein n=1 Tax=Friedmanniomyces simplex TaxID=329884 RepID=A0A4U0Y0F1_9PEZI|nr:hypothetical protein B0A55_01779 [Friedmanniomyces simplex]
MVPFRLAAAWLTLLTASVWAQRDGLSQQYCSSENTGSDYQAVYNIYQSNGACHDQCDGSYAFAVVQWQNCWCSNYIPADQQSTSNCNQNCPGYPAEQCGNESAGLYGYIPLYRHPEGTAGGASSTQASSTPVSSATTPSSTQQSSTQPETSTSQQPTTQEPTSTSQPPATSITSSSTSSSSSDPPPSSTTTTSASPTSSSTEAPVVAPVPATIQTSSSSPPQSATPSPVTSVRVVTVSGAIVTQTVTSTPFVVPNSNADAQPLQRKQLSGGAIAGIVIGTLLGLAALLLLAFLLLRRRKQNRDSEGLARGPTSPRRKISVLSRTGLLSRGRPTSMAENNAYAYAYDDAANPPTGQNSVRHSMLFGAAGAGAGLGGVEGVSPVSPLGSSHDNDNDGDRRYSGRAMVYDQRLNPSALFANAEANGSRVSMQDQRDYSRPLGVANPDPRPSFESRG